MLEMLLILVIISLCLVINIHLFNNSNLNNYYYKEIELLKSELIKAKQLAIIKRSNTFIIFNNNKLETINENNYHHLEFKVIQFQKNKELYFNRNGNINQGQTINFKYNYQIHKVIFYLGKGWFYIE
jgi:hypothetical protein